ncbi:MAG: 2-succinyl-6-hydroxy-2,4-cyclohexadiene-1-carboxylate synthase [Turneriella sp.]|nr:2-succinyl-6-hydroxy-2,4-cyclohexadiene-1-carboxylate synthase [Turneriella sp.]
MGLKKKILYGFLVLIIGYIAAIFFKPTPTYTSPPIKLAANFEAFYQDQLQQSKKLGARLNNEERLLRVRNGKTPYAILYIHGFGASRGEGEYSMDRLAQKWGANTYYIRLPGHGTNIEDHVAKGYSEYLAYCEKALAHMKFLGEKTVVVGTSMGGLLATWLAASHPNQVDALILASPFYDFSDPTARILELPGGVSLGELVVGKLRAKPEERDKNDVDGLAGYWYRPQYTKALKNLNDLRHFAANDETYAKVKQPVLMLVYYKDEKNKDQVASIKAMRHAFSVFATPKNQKHFVEIQNGSHVLFSKWVKTDKETVDRELYKFAKSLPF